MTIFDILSEKILNKNVTIPSYDVNGVVTRIDISGDTYDGFTIEIMIDTILYTIDPFFTELIINL